jgi:hypothetical protein
MKKKLENSKKERNSPPPDQSTAMEPPTQSVSLSSPRAESAEGK